MKASSLLSAAFFSLLALALSAQENSLDFSYSGSRTVRSLENNLQYSFQPLRQSLLEISGLNSTEQRLSFDQNSRHTMLNADLRLTRRLLSHVFHSGFEFLFDHSSLEAGLQPYRNRTGWLGYTLDFSPADSLLLSGGLKAFVRSEEDRYLAGNVLDSDGYQLTGRASAGAGLGDHLRAGAVASLEQKELDWEYYRSAGLNAYLHYTRELLVFSNQFNYNNRTDRLYVLPEALQTGERSSYILFDTQQRSTLNYSGNVDYIPWTPLRITLQETYSRRITEMQQNLVRNNADYINQAALAADLNLRENLYWNISLNHSYATKAFNFSANTRQTEMRNIASSLAWEYAGGDTLAASVSIDLQRTSFPDDGNRWDNDNRNIRWQISNAHYWRQRVKLSNRLFWNLTDDVYLKGILSDNNKSTNSLVYNPACAILIGDRLLFNQSYQLRADYSSYMYDSAKKAFYRQLEIQYKLVFDSKPLTANSSDPIWMLLPYRKPSINALRADLSFGYERSEYADHDGSQYLINYKNTRYSAGLTLKHDIGNLYYIVQPRYSWGTWQEYNLLFGLAWKFTSQSLLEFSLNPNGEALDQLDWRTSVSLSARF